MSQYFHFLFHISVNGSVYWTEEKKNVSKWFWRRNEVCGTNNKNKSDKKQTNCLTFLILGTNKCIIRLKGGCLQKCKCFRCCSLLFFFFVWRKICSIYFSSFFFHILSLDVLRIVSLSALKTKTMSPQRTWNEAKWT